MDEDQITPVLSVFSTVAVNCWIPAEGTLTSPGVLETRIGGSIVRVAVADTLGSATLVAVTVVVLVVLTMGAVNNPLLEIVPCGADQVTPFLLLPVTVALNGWVMPEFIFTVLGVIDTVTGGTTVTVAVADFVGSATLVAVTETTVSVVTDGAVNRPPLEMFPFVVDQVTFVLSEFVTVAVNCCVNAEKTFGLLGDTAT
jgi:hypothetical protein